jgi:hypothetical protein
MLGGWAYGAIYRDSAERSAALDGWLWHYNHHRKHSALGHKPPIARVHERTNLLGTYSPGLLDKHPARRGFGLDVDELCLERQLVHRLTEIHENLTS